jgi:hypothetical protein
MEKVKSFIELATKGKQFVEPTGFQSIIASIREMEPEQPEGKYYTNFRNSEPKCYGTDGRPNYGATWS